MIQPFGNIISKRGNDLKKCISKEPGMGLGKKKKGYYNLLSEGKMYFLKMVHPKNE